MNKIIFSMMILLSFTTHSKEVQKCEPNTLPRFVCNAVPSDDGIYRLTQSPITVCHGKNVIHIVSKSNTRDVYNATLKQTSSTLKYTINDLEENQPVAELKINKANPAQASFRFIGDDQHQDRVCLKVK